MTLPAKRTGFTKSEKGLLIATVLFVTLVGVLAWWWDEINRNPVVTIPTPVMPSPNARDYYFKAGTSLVWLDVYRITEGVCNGTLPSLDAGAKPTVTPKAPASHPLTLVEVEAGVKKNQPAFAILREGFQYEYGEMPARSIYDQFPHDGHIRSTVRALVADSYVKAIHGDWPGAANSYLDAMEVGATCSRGANLFGGLIGIASQAIGRGEMWRTVDHLDAGAANTAAKRLESIMAKQPSLADITEEQKWYGQATRMEFFHMPRKEWTRLYWSNFPLDQSVALLTCNKREVMANYTTYMDKLIAEYRKPYAIRTPVPIPADPFYQLLDADHSEAEFTWTINDTYTHLLLTMLALRAYRLEHGAYPATLAALCPKYLATVPDDPFALRGPLRYKVMGKTYLLYSIGPDGKDNGGTPSKDGRQPTSATKVVRPIRATSTGDLVAGVNVR